MTTFSCHICPPALSLSHPPLSSRDRDSSASLSYAQANYSQSRRLNLPYFLARSRDEKKGGKRPTEKQRSTLEAAKRALSSSNFEQIKNNVESALSNPTLTRTPPKFFPTTAPRFHEKLLSPSIAMRPYSFQLHPTPVRRLGGVVN
mmetsp:Transcript_46316/g.119537  ORF Transcript_46316/g.119537 Transcript_46316/m.119537 type:complete len:146 (-) Transcript_46316:14-451(-)